MQPDHGEPAGHQLRSHPERPVGPDVDRGLGAVDRQEPQDPRLVGCHLAEDALVGGVDSSTAHTSAERSAARRRGRGSSARAATGGRLVHRDAGLGSRKGRGQGPGGRPRGASVTTSAMASVGASPRSHRSQDLVPVSIGRRQRPVGDPPTRARPTTRTRPGASSRTLRSGPPAATAASGPMGSWSSISDPEDSQMEEAGPASEDGPVQEEQPLVLLDGRAQQLGELVGGSWRIWRATKSLIFFACSRPNASSSKAEAKSAASGRHRCADPVVLAAADRDPQRPLAGPIALSTAGRRVSSSIWWVRSERGP